MKIRWNLLKRALRFCFEGIVLNLGAHRFIDAWSLRLLRVTS